MGEVKKGSERIGMVRCLNCFARFRVPPRYVPASTVSLRKKREAGLKFSELMKKFAGA